MNGDFRRIVKLVIKPILHWVENFRRSLSEIAWLMKRNGQVKQYYRTAGLKKLNIGCGANQLPGWLNADFVPGAPEVIFLDATQRYPLKSNSFDYVFSEHMIEHVSYDLAMEMLKECYRILKPGGRLRIDTPDLQKIINLFSNEKSEEQKQYVDWFTNKFAHSEATRVYHECFVLNKMVREWGHQFIYDAWTLADAMSKMGFKECTRLSVGQSPDAELTGIEGHNDVSGDAVNAYETLVIEAIK